MPSQVPGYPDSPGHSPVLCSGQRGRAAAQGQRAGLRAPGFRADLASLSPGASLPGQRRARDGAPWRRREGSRAAGAHGPEEARRHVLPCQPWRRREGSTGWPRRGPGAPHTQLSALREEPGPGPLQGPPVQQPCSGTAPTCRKQAAGARVRLGAAVAPHTSEDRALGLCGWQGGRRGGRGPGRQAQSRGLPISEWWAPQASLPEAGGNSSSSRGTKPLIHP